MIKDLKSQSIMMEMVINSLIDLFLNQIFLKVSC